MSFDEIISHIWVHTSYSFCIKIYHVLSFGDGTNFISDDCSARYIGRRHSIWIIVTPHAASVAANGFVWTFIASAFGTMLFRSSRPGGLPPHTNQTLTKKNMNRPSTTFSGCLETKNAVEKGWGNPRGKSKNNTHRRISTRSIFSL